MEKEVRWVGVLLLLILSLSSVSGLGEQRSTGLREEGGYEKKSSAYDQVHENIQTSIAQGSTLDLSQSLYKNNKDVVRKVLREKYNVDVSSIDSARVVAGKLTLPGGTSIDMQTGRRITLDASGSQVRSMTDGETTVVDAKGVNFDGVNLKVTQANSVTYRNTESTNVNNFVGSTGRIIVIDAGKYITLPKGL